MSNYHLRDMSSALKAKVFLSLIPSLLENWDYTMKGLARICEDGIGSISSSVRDLETHGYEDNIYYKGIGLLEMSKVFDSRQK